MQCTTKSTRITNTQLEGNDGSRAVRSSYPQIAQACSKVKRVSNSSKRYSRLSGAHFIGFLAALSLCGASSAAAETVTIDVQIVGGEVQGETTLRVKQGESIAVTFHSDVAIALHLHGYDVETHIKPGIPVTMMLDAQIAGRFAVEVHGHAHPGSKHRTLLYLEVHPR